MTINDKNFIVRINSDLTQLKNFKVKISGVKIKSRHCKILQILKQIYNCEIKDRYFHSLDFDFYVYGGCYQQYKKFNYFQKLIRRFKRLPLDRIRIDPRIVRFSQPNNKDESFIIKLNSK